jgi:hypothetical protein
MIDFREVEESKAFDSMGVNSESVSNGIAPSIPQQVKNIISQEFEHSDECSWEAWPKYRIKRV